MFRSFIHKMVFANFKSQKANATHTYKKKKWKPKWKREKILLWIHDAKKFNHRSKDIERIRLFWWERERGESTNHMRWNVSTFNSIGHWRKWFIPQFLIYIIFVWLTVIISFFKFGQSLFLFSISWRPLALFLSAEKF